MVRVIHNVEYIFVPRWRRAHSRLAPRQWKTSLQSNAVSHWLRANLESTLLIWWPLTPRSWPDNERVTINWTTSRKRTRPLLFNYKKSSVDNRLNDVTIVFVTIPQSTDWWECSSLSRVLNVVRALKNWHNICIWRAVNNDCSITRNDLTNDFIVRHSWKSWVNHPTSYLIIVIHRKPCIIFFIVSGIEYFTLIYHKLSNAS